MGLQWQFEEPVPEWLQEETLANGVELEQIERLGLLGSPSAFDPNIQELMHAGWFDQDIDSADRKEARAELKETLKNEYGVDFDNIFDYGEWRDLWYE